MRKPSIEGIDWTAPATEIIDELVERHITANNAHAGKYGYSDEELMAATEWAEDMFAKHAE